MTDRRAFAVLVRGNAERPMGNERLVVEPIVEEGRRRGFDVGLFDLTTLADPADAPGTWFDRDGGPGRPGRYEVPLVVHDRHLGGIVGDHPRRLALARTRSVFNSPAVQEVTVDKREAGRVLRDAGIPVPAEVVRRRPWSAATVDKPRYGSRSEGVRVDRGGLPGWIDRLRRRSDHDPSRIRQHFVEPVPFKGRHPHVKVHVQRNPDGALGVAHSAARYWLDGIPPSTGQRAVAEPVSHYASVVPRALLGRESLEAMTGRLAVQAARAIETVDASLFELGVDVVVGRAEGLMVIEVNSKPGHSSYRHLAKTETLPVAIRAEARERERASFGRVVDEVERRLG